MKVSNSMQSSILHTKQDIEIGMNNSVGGFALRFVKAMRYASKKITDFFTFPFRLLSSFIIKKTVETMPVINPRDLAKLAKEHETLINPIHDITANDESLAGIPKAATDFDLYGFGSTKVLSQPSNGRFDRLSQLSSAFFDEEDTNDNYMDINKRVNNLGF